MDTPTIERDQTDAATPRGSRRTLVLVAAIVVALGAVAWTLTGSSDGHSRPDVEPADVTEAVDQGQIDEAAELAHGRLNAAIWGDRPLEDAEGMAHAIEQLSGQFDPSSHWDGVALDAAEALRAGDLMLAHNLLARLDWTANDWAPRTPGN